MAASLSCITVEPKPRMISRASTRAAYHGVSAASSSGRRPGIAVSGGVLVVLSSNSAENTRPNELRRQRRRERTAYHFKCCRIGQSTRLIAGWC